MLKLLPTYGERGEAASRERRYRHYLLACTIDVFNLPMAREARQPTRAHPPSARFRPPLFLILSWLGVPTYGEIRAPLPSPTFPYLWRLSSPTFTYLWRLWRGEARRGSRRATERGPSFGAIIPYNFTSLEIEARAIPYLHLPTFGEAKRGSRRRQGLP